MTQHHHTPPPDPMPLDPEERALAARLARLGPHGEPSPADQASINASSPGSSPAAAMRPAGRSAGLSSIRVRVRPRPAAA